MTRKKPIPADTCTVIYVDKQGKRVEEQTATRWREIKAPKRKRGKPKAA